MFPGDNDCLDSGGSERYTYHQDANFRVVMLTDESGDVVERYDYTAYGEPTVHEGGSTEAGNALLVSSVGSPFMHQGLFLDAETRSYQNRFRQYNPRLGRFMQRDPIGYAGGLSASTDLCAAGLPVRPDTERRRINTRRGLHEP